MLRDPMLLINIQLAIVGIVVVAGLFYLWRMICRVEKKVNDMILNTPPPSFPCNNPLKNVNPMSSPIHDEELDEETEQFMKDVFGPNPPIFMPPPYGKSFVNTGVKIEEEAIDKKEADVEAAKTTPHEDGSSEMETQSMVHISDGKLSKSKLKRMSVDALKDACKERGLNSDGTKANLVERLLDILEEGDE